MRRPRQLPGLACAALLAAAALGWLQQAGLAAARAKQPSLDEAHAALQNAQQAATLHQQAAAAAKVKTRADAAQAALLAEQQIAAAVALRRLEQQTGNDAGTLAGLQAQSASTAQALRDNAAALARLLPVMERLSSQPAATMLAVPEAPRDAVRGILIMQGIATAIEQRAEAVRRQTRQVAALTAQSQHQARVLAAAVAAQQHAEDRLTAQIAAARSIEMQDAETALSEAGAAIEADHRVHGMQGVIDRLIAVPAPPPPASHVSMNQGMNQGVNHGVSAAPVAGMVVQKFGDATVAGPAEGVSYRAAPGARVVTPCAGPVLFADNFQSYGMIVIMSCGGGYDFVMSGMQHLDVAAGQRLSHGQPVGEMLRYDPYEPTRQPLLYVELRRNGTPVDPTSWLAGGGSG